MTAPDNAVPNKQYKPYQVPPKDKPAAGVLARQSKSLWCHADAITIVKNNFKETEFRQEYKPQFSAACIIKNSYDPDSIMQLHICLC